jgi:lysyl-tRNA synthetase class II
VSQLVDGYTATPAAELEASRVDTVTAGRLVSVRSFGKASFLVLSDGRSRIQVYVRQDALSERDYQLSKLLDLGDQLGVTGTCFAPRPTSSRSGPRRCSFSRSVSCRCPRSGTDSRTSRFAIGSATSI